MPWTSSRASATATRPPPSADATRAVEVVPAERGRAHREFLALPYRLHGHDARFVPPLRRDRAALFDRARHPFFRHADAAYFVARRHGRPVGCIEAVVNHAHNRFHGDRVGFFGAFECADDRSVADALLGRAAAWLTERGMAVMRGPVTHSTNEACGLLVEGFDDPALVGMPWNPSYYAPLLEGFGLRKAKDLYMWQAATDAELPAKVRRIAERVAQDPRTRIRGPDLREYDAEVRRVMDVYNASWERNWGFVPLTDAEFAHAAQQLRPLVARHPEGVLIVEIDGRPAGFCLTVMDVNQALAGLRDGRLFPCGFLRLLRGFKRVNRARVMAFGVRPEYRNLGLDALLLITGLDIGRRRGLRHVEVGWTLEDNAIVDRALAAHARRTKTYRLYDVALT
jgi:GNAT superfamily N-acetyltransferase